MSYWGYQNAGSRAMMTHRHTCGYLPRQKGDGWHEFCTVDGFLRYLTAHNPMARGYRRDCPVYRGATHTAKQPDLQIGPVAPFSICRIRVINHPGAVEHTCWLSSPGPLPGTALSAYLVCHIQISTEAMDGPICINGLPLE